MAQWFARGGCPPLPTHTPPLLGHHSNRAARRRAPSAGLARPTDRPTAPHPEGSDPTLAREECGTRALMREWHGAAKWTCFRVDAEQEFAPKRVATLPEPGIEASNTAAICLVGQVSSALRFNATRARDEEDTDDGGGAPRTDGARPRPERARARVGEGQWCRRLLGGASRPRGRH